MTNPLLRTHEVNMVNEIINNCSSLEDTAIAAKAIDSLEKSQPNEKATIWEMRQIVCDLSFEYYAKRYAQQKN